MKNNEQKIIRGIELNCRKKKEQKELDNELDYIDCNEHLTERYVSDSELLRIVEAIDENNIVTRDVCGKKVKYLPGIIFVKVGYNLPKYNKIKENDGVLVLNHKHFEVVKVADKEKSQLDVTYEDESKTIPKKEYFKRLMVGSGHNRCKKAIFIREDLFDKAHKILLGGIDTYEEMNHYKNYSKGYAKWNSYYALPSTDSKAVKRIPNIIVIPDYKRKNVEDTFDMVYQYKDVNPEWQEGHELQYKYTKTYDVKRNQKRNDVEIMPFDGAGLISVECAKEWVRDLQIKNEKGNSYIPANFQFRIIPGFKGNVYTFDIEEFGKENGNIIVDINGEPHDIRKEKVDLILTASQAKFISLFANDINKWKSVFEKPVIFYKKDENGNDMEEIECQYQRTFNISDYAEDVCDLKKTMQSAYQHLQTVFFTDDEIKSYTQRTVDKIANSTKNMDNFLKYRGVTEKEKQNNPSNWKRIPPYYRAAFEIPIEKREVLFADEYFRSKMKMDVDGMMNRALVGKEDVEGNYQTLIPDVYALAQFAFGERDNKKIGLLQPNEVYSNWWIHRKDEEGTYDVPEQIALIRNPHIFMEARVVKLVHDKMLVNVEEVDGILDGSLEDYLKKIRKWYKYQKTGIVTDSFSTIPLALGTADFDGDHIASTNSEEYISAVERARGNCNGNTVDYEIVKSEAVKNEESKAEIDITAIEKLMEFDVLGFLNNIGTVIDKVTALWGTMEESTKDKDKLMKYIAIADIIGQLTIDAAKTGEFEEFYPEISKYLKKVVALEPYFKKYLSKNEEKYASEKRAFNNVKNHCNGDEEIKKSQKKFSEFQSNMNRICWYMEKQIAEINRKLDDIEFDVDKFSQLFIVGDVNVKSDLYKRVRKVLLELSQKHNEIFEYHVCDNEHEDLEIKDKHYRWFYENSRNRLLSECKLSEEKSINKVLNIVVYLCYKDSELKDNNNAKSIMWNVFTEEMIARASGDVSDSKFDWSKLEERTRETTNFTDKVFSKQVRNRKQLTISELSEKNVKSPIVITEQDLTYVRNMIKPSSIIDGKALGNKHAKELRRLYIVMMAISKRCEYDVAVEQKKTGELKTYHRKKEIVIHQSANGKLNVSTLARLAGFTDYQRKQIDPKMLLQLQALGMLTLNTKKMDKLRYKVEYEMNPDIPLEESVIDSESYDYQEICRELRNRFR